MEGQLNYPFKRPLNRDPVQRIVAILALRLRRDVERALSRFRRLQADCRIMPTARAAAATH
ncbi:MAG: hypothetical protein CL801_14865 [Citromicrobium sp.]|nr:hypothetical protein [Citromicrobium sp.]|tara:strand:- start:18568 stop:18750 length:183 start_codon:yes stop_codon:yes gene_type:complete